MLYCSRHAAEITRLPGLPGVHTCDDVQHKRSTQKRLQAAVARMADFRTRVVPRIQAILTYSFKAPEVEYFLQRYPNARVVTLHYKERPYYILLRRN